MRTRFAVTLAVAGFAAATAAVSTWAVGPTPGFVPNGIVAPGGHVRYAGVANGTETTVEAVQVGSGRVLRSIWLDAVHGVPLVAYDGTAGGLTHDGKLLVLSTSGADDSTSFVVLTTKRLELKRAISLKGMWAFDALSPEGRTLNLNQILSTNGPVRYLVRACDLKLGRLVPGAIADKSEPGAMTGYPMSRVTGAGGRWAYTLYQRTNGTAFIHALDTRTRRAVCLDLSVRGGIDFGRTRLTLSRDGHRLVVRRAGGETESVAVPR
jgi:hypothetical protein